MDCDVVAKQEECFCVGIRCGPVHAVKERDRQACQLVRFSDKSTTGWVDQELRAALIPAF